jgi:predicted nucleic acid-binding Zn ribbon protein
MNKDQNHIDPHKIISTCAWCGKKIPKGSEIFSVGTKVRSGIDLHDQGGRVIQVFLAKCGKTVNAIAPTDNSQAKKAGNDLVFAICSQQCGSALKQTLQEELNTISDQTH